jgi:hypothetical protein
VASDLDKYPEPKPGLVFRYDYLRPREFADGIEHGKERPACILVPLKEGEVFQNVTVIDETSKRTTANYVAGKNDIAIICIQTDPPDKNQLGVKLDLLTKQYIGLPGDKESWAIVSEVNIDTWPSSGMNHIPGKPGQFVYQRPMPGPMMAQLAKLFLRLCEHKKIWALKRHP